MTKKLRASTIQAYLATKSPDEEINLTTLATELADNNLQQAVTFFSTLPEAKKVQYLWYLYNYYYNLLMEDSGGEAWLLELNADNPVLQDLEDSFIIPYNLDTTQIVPLRKLISRLQKEVAKQRQHRKEKDASVIVEEDRE